MPTEAENMALIQQQIRMAQRAPEPGEDRVGTVVYKGDKEEDGAPPQIISSLDSAGYCYIWNTKTGDRSVTNLNMLATQLRKRFEDGTQVFTVIDPGITPRRGSHKCLLHPDDPDREYYDSLGLATCRKANLKSEYEVERHMEHRHKSEWAAILRNRREKERVEDREWQRKLMQVASGNALQEEHEERPLYVSERPKAKKGSMAA